MEMKLWAAATPNQERSRKIKELMDPAWSRLNHYEQEFLISIVSRLDTDDTRRMTDRQWRYLETLEARLRLMRRYPRSRS